MAKTKDTGMDIEFNKVREMLRKELTDRYGGVSKFFHSEKGKEFGGIKSKIYIYDTGPVNYEFIGKLCKFLGIGELSRKIVVSRCFKYRLNVFPNNNLKTS